MGDHGGVSWQDCSCFPWTLPGDRHSGAHTATCPQGFLYQDDQIKRMEGFSLEGCGRGRVFQAFAFRRGGDDAQWPESMGLWRILPTVAHPPLLTVSCLSQMLGLLARAPLCHIPGISSLTAVLASSFDFQFSHYPKLGFCLFLVTLS